MSVWSSVGGKPQISYAERLRRAKEISDVKDSSTTGEGASTPPSGPKPSITLAPLKPDDSARPVEPAQSGIPPTAAVASSWDADETESKNKGQGNGRAETDGKATSSSSSSIEAKSNSASGPNAANNADSTTTGAQETAGTTSPSAPKAPAVNVWEMRIKQKAEAEAAALKAKREAEEQARASAIRSQDSKTLKTIVKPKQSRTSTNASISTTTSSLDGQQSPQTGPTKAGAKAAGGGGGRNDPQSVNGRAGQPGKHKGGSSASSVVSATRPVLNRDNSKGQRKSSVDSVASVQPGVLTDASATAGDDYWLQKINMLNGGLAQSPAGLSQAGSTATSSQSPRASHRSSKASQTLADVNAVHGASSAKSQRSQSPSDNKRSKQGASSDRGRPEQPREATPSKTAAKSAAEKRASAANKGDQSTVASSSPTSRSSRGGVGSIPTGSWEDPEDAANEAYGQQSGGPTSRSESVAGAPHEKRGGLASPSSNKGQPFGMPQNPTHSQGGRSSPVYSGNDRRAGNSSSSSPTRKIQTSVPRPPFMQSPHEVSTPAGPRYGRSPSPLRQGYLESLANSPQIRARRPSETSTTSGASPYNNMQHYREGSSDDYRGMRGNLPRGVSRGRGTRGGRGRGRGNGRFDDRYDESGARGSWSPAMQMAPNERDPGEGQDGSFSGGLNGEAHPYHPGHIPHGAVPMHWDGYNYWPMDPRFINQHANHHDDQHQNASTSSDYPTHPGPPHYADVHLPNNSDSGTFAPHQTASAQPGAQTSPRRPSDDPVSGLVKQIEFYFSIENLQHDFFLRQQMKHDGGWVPLGMVKTFKRLKALMEDSGIDVDSPAVKERLQHCVNVELSPDGNQVRTRHGWPQWLVNGQGAAAGGDPHFASPMSQGHPGGPMGCNMYDPMQPPPQHWYQPPHPMYFPQQQQQPVAPHQAFAPHLQGQHPAGGSHQQEYGYDSAQRQRQPSGQSNVSPPHGRMPMLSTPPSFPHLDAQGNPVFFPPQPSAYPGSPPQPVSPASLGHPQGDLRGLAGGPHAAQWPSGTPLYGQQAPPDHHHPSSSASSVRGAGHGGHFSDQQYEARHQGRPRDEPQSAPAAPSGHPLPPVPSRATYATPPNHRPSFPGGQSSPGASRLYDGFPPSAYQRFDGGGNSYSFTSPSQIDLSSSSGSGSLDRKRTSTSTTAASTSNGHDTSSGTPGSRGTMATSTPSSMNDSRDKIRDDDDEEEEEGLGVIAAEGLGGLVGGGKKD